MATFLADAAGRRPTTVRAGSISGKSPPPEASSGDDQGPEKSTQVEAGFPEVAPRQIAHEGARIQRELISSGKWQADRHLFPVLRPVKLIF